MMDDPDILNVDPICFMHIDYLLTGEVRHRLAEAYRFVITGDNGWKEYLDQNMDLIDLNIIMDHTESCSCGRFFEQHPTKIENTEPAELDLVLEQVRTGKCKCLRDVPIDDLSPPTISETPASKHLLHAACASGYQTMDIVDYLLEKGCYVNVTTNLYSYTPLFRAVVSKNMEVVQRLLAHKSIDVNARCRKEQYTALLEAVVNRYHDVVALLIAHPSINLNACNFRGETAVIAAARMGESEILEQLLVAGAEVNLLDSRACSALMYSVMYDMKKVTKVLLQYGSDLNQHSSHGETPLIMAISSDSFEVAKILLDAGADPNLPSSTGYMPLMVATYSNSTSMVKLLMEYNVNLTYANDLGYQAIHIAAWNGHLGILNLLVSAGVDLDPQTRDFNTPLSLAAHGNYGNVVGMLMARGCNVNNADKDQDTPLHYATFNSNIECTQALLNNGANPGFVNRLGVTPLWNSVYCGNSKIVKLLLKHNVALDIPSQGIDQTAGTELVQTIFDTPRTPLWVAAHQGHCHLAYLLIITGCRITSESWIAQGNFPGKSESHEELKELLRLFHSRPLPLVFQCRIFLRRLAGSEIRRFTLMLKIPEKLRKFLMMKDELE